MRNIIFLFGCASRPKKASALEMYIEPARLSLKENVIMSYGPENFSDPARLQQYGCEYVYAVTVTFSKNPL